MKKLNMGWTKEDIKRMEKDMLKRPSSQRLFYLSFALKVEMEKLFKKYDIKQFVKGKYDFRKVILNELQKAHKHYNDKK